MLPSFIDLSLKFQNFNFKESAPGAYAQDLHSYIQIIYGYLPVSFSRAFVTHKLLEHLASFFNKESVKMVL